MKISIVDIYDRGVPNKERLALKVVFDVNLNYFVVLDSTYTTPQSLSQRPKGAMWLPAVDVKAGDLIVVYSGSGTNSEIKNQDGSTTRFFYWGSPTTLWNNVGDCAVVLELSSWQTTKYQ